MKLAALTKTQRDEYDAVLRSGYILRIQVDFLDTDGDITGSFATDSGVDGTDEASRNTAITVVGGEVTMDLDSDISRACRLEVHDPKRMLRWAHRDAHDFAVYVGRMLQVTYGVYLPTAAEWADVPVFTGPVTRFERQGATVGIDCAGKEWFLLDPFFKWRSMSWRNHVQVVDVMQAILRDQGERSFRGFPATDPKHRLAKGYSIARWEQPWPNLRKLAQLAGDKLLYYAGDGAVVLRAKASGTTWEFTEGKDVLSDPVFTYDLEDLRNAVVGTWEKGDKKGDPQVALVGRDFPLSPQSLARNNRPLVMAHLMESSKKKAPEVMADARTALNRYTVTPVEVAFDALPIPHLEEYQRLGITWEGERVVFTLRSFTLGLLSGGTMSLNYTSDQVRKAKEVV